MNHRGCWLVSSAPPRAARAPGPRHLLPAARGAAAAPGSALDSFTQGLREAPSVEPTPGQLRSGRPPRRTRRTRNPRAARCWWLTRSTPPSAMADAMADAATGLGRGGSQGRLKILAERLLDSPNRTKTWWDSLSHLISSHLISSHLI
eukprot:SAG31_NODE_1203_length_9413_cov_4.778076_11_plen_148_part_00